MFTFNFQNKQYSSLPKIYQTKYPDSSIGWLNGVYQNRTVSISEIKDNATSSGLKITTKDWKELGSPLNGDSKTRPLYHYSETTHVAINIPNANYDLTLNLKNIERFERTIDIIINHVIESTITFPPLTSKQVKLHLALSVNQFDLSFANHNCANSKENSLSWNLLLMNFTLKQSELPMRDKKLGIYIASDSTAQSYSRVEEPQSGWGEELYHQFKGSVVKITNSSFYPQATRYETENNFIDNRSMGARSSKTFISEGRLEAILKVILPGDYLLIQFGDNDATAIRPNRYVPAEKFAYYIRQYIESAQVRRAHPILISPPAQFKFDSKLHEFVTTFDSYRDVMKKLSEEYQIPFIDLGNNMIHLMNRIGYNAAHSLYLQVNKDEYPNLANDKKDITHFQHFGAFKLAQIIATNLSKIIDSNQFLDRGFTQDKRPEIDKRLNRIILKWDQVAKAAFYVIEMEQGKKWKYNSVTTFNESYIVPTGANLDSNENVRQNYRVTAFDDNGDFIKEKIITLVI